MYNNKKQILIFGLGAIIITSALIFISQEKTEPIAFSHTGSMTVKMNKTSKDTFQFEGKSISTNMEQGCTLPASMNITINNVSKKGEIKVFLNDQMYAFGNITETGPALLSSGCGCSTVCICEIQVGSNFFVIESLGFEGELEYFIKTR